ncbi:hypothetical protein [Herminiimonas sp. CN]|uniref:hypothetical protein n=1 Tax=Herminiimonas sp. CN TaxID=1349818 RepID=UPI0012DD5453|nr:hypothetical protein [Herminiimonas sp. CN]
MTSPAENPQQTPEQPPQERSADSPGAAAMARLFVVSIVVVALTLIVTVAGQIYYG